MHACLSHIYNHALPYLFLFVLFSKIGHDHVRAKLLKQRPEDQERPSGRWMTAPQ
jgi:hypothetical protein